MKNVVRWQHLIEALGPPTSERDINSRMPDGSWGIVTVACANPDHVAISNATNLCVAGTSCSAARRRSADVAKLRSPTILELKLGWSRVSIACTMRAM